MVNPIHGSFSQNPNFSQIKKPNVVPLEDAINEVSHNLGNTSQQVTLQFNKDFSDFVNLIFNYEEHPSPINLALLNAGAGKFIEEVKNLVPNWSSDPKLSQALSQVQEEIEKLNNQA